MPILVEYVIVLALVSIVIIVVVTSFLNPNGPPVAGPCRLVSRPWRKDYCGGNCPGQTCIVLTTKPWANGIFGATQAASCKCVTLVGPLPPGSVGGIPPTPLPGGDTVAPVSGQTRR